MFNDTERPTIQEQTLPLETSMAQTDFVRKIKKTTVGGVDTWTSANIEFSDFEGQVVEMATEAAKGYAYAAKVSEDKAKISEDNAAQSETNSAASEYNSSASAANALTSEQNAEAYKDSIRSSYKLVSKTDPTADYTEIADAIAASTSGQKIVVDGGSYKFFEIPAGKDYIQIEGRGLSYYDYTDKTIKGNGVVVNILNGAQGKVNIASNYCKISNIAVQGLTDKDGITITGNKAELRNLVINGFLATQLQHAILFEALGANGLYLENIQVSNFYHGFALKGSNVIGRNLYAEDIKGNGLIWKADQYSGNITGFDLVGFRCYGRTLGNKAIVFQSVGAYTLKNANIDNINIDTVAEDGIWMTADNASGRINNININNVVLNTSGAYGIRATHANTSGTAEIDFINITNYVAFGVTTSSLYINSSSLSTSLRCTNAYFTGSAPVSATWQCFLTNQSLQSVTEAISFTASQYFRGLVDFDSNLRMPNKAGNGYVNFVEHDTTQAENMKNLLNINKFTISRSYADDAAAKAAGLTATMLYKDLNGKVCVVL